MEVLFEDNLAQEPWIWQGHTGNYIKVRLESGQDLRNRLLAVELKGVRPEFSGAELC